jgi:hypothetical protein
VKKVEELGIGTWGGKLDSQKSMYIIHRFKKD